MSIYFSFACPIIFLQWHSNLSSNVSTVSFPHQAYFSFVHKQWFFFLFTMADISTILTPDDLQSFQYNIPPYQHNHQTNHRYILRHSTNCKHAIITSDSRLKSLWLFSVTTLGVKAAAVALFHPPVVLVQSPSSWKSAERAWSTYSGRLNLWNEVVISFKKYPSDRLLYHRYPHNSRRSKLKNFR